MPPSLSRSWDISKWLRAGCCRRAERRRSRALSSRRAAIFLFVPTPCGCVCGLESRCRAGRGAHPRVGLAGAGCPMARKRAASACAVQASHCAGGASKCAWFWARWSGARRVSKSCASMGWGWRCLQPSVPGRSPCRRVVTGKWSVPTISSTVGCVGGSWGLVRNQSRVFPWIWVG